ncbi:hypothetical protein [Halobacillus sp. H74]|uniref:hypothetical protein n=1 Tax=Halobacillus sp. H74 TaxID=3457436 RepID=UPI003FCE6954
MKAKCINASGSMVLEEGREYFVFPAGASYYVSRFDNESSHMGCFQSKRFQVLEEVDSSHTEQLSLF